MFPGVESNLIINFDKFVNKSAVTLVQNNGKEMYSKNLLKHLTAQQTDMSQGKQNKISSIV